MTQVAGLLYAVALVFLVREGARRLNERRFDVWFVLVGCAIALAVWLSVPSASIPIELVTETHEGRTARSIRALYAQGSHSLQAHDLLLSALRGAERVDIRDAVRLNLALTVLGAWLLGLFAARLGGRWSVGVVAAALFLVSPSILNAAVSPYGAPLGTVVVLLALPALERLLRADSTRDERLEAFFLGLSLLLLSSLVRVDWLLGVVWWVPCGLLAVWRDAAWMPQLSSFVVRTLRLRRVRVGLAVGLLALNFINFPGRSDWVLPALQPLSLDILRLPSITAKLAVPLSVVALATIGAMRLFRMGPAGWWGPLVVAGLFKLFRMAGHNVSFEYLRYLSAWVAPALLLAAFGWRVLSSTLGGWRLGAGSAAIAALSLVMSPWSAWSLDAVYGKDPVIWPLARDKQIEVRLLLSALDTYPQCLFVSRATRTDTGPPQAWGYVIFGKSLTQPVEVDEVADTADPLGAALSVVAHPPCVMLYRGIDCNLSGVDCLSIEAGLEPVAEWEFQSSPYSDKGEYGPWPETLRLGLYRVPLPAASSNGRTAPP